MGIGPNWSICSSDAHNKCPPPVIGNPNPAHFKISRCEAVGTFVVVLVEYPDCVNYEGMKILVFEGVTVKKIKSLKSMDPHFCNSHEHISPIARFVPTSKGWDYALKFCRTV